MRNLFSDLRASLPPRFKWFGVFLIIGMAISAVLELIALGMVMPLATALAAPDLLETNERMHRLHEFLGAPDRSHFIIELAILLCVLFVLKNAFAFVMTKCQSRFSADISINIAGRLYKNYVGTDYAYHLKYSASELVARIVQIRDVTHLLLIPLLLVLSEGCVFLAILLVIFILIPGIALCSSVICGTVVLVFHFLFKRSLNRASEQILHASEESMRTMNQSFSAIREIKLSGSGEFFRKQLVKAQTKIVYAMKLQNDLGQIPRYSLEVFVILAGSALICLVILLGIPYENIVLYAAFFVAAMFRLIPSVSRIQYNLIFIRGTSCVFHQICNDLSEIHPEPMDEIDGKQNLCFEKELRLDHVSFSYEASSKPVICDLSLSILPNECIAITGPTGAGKSTLADLIMGFLKPQSGTITADGMPILQNLNAWRNMIGYVPQNIFLFYGTIRENIAFGIPAEQIDDVRIAEVIKIAQLDDFIGSLPNGARTIIGEAGVTLSGGQRQRIAIARALYRKPQILILDEATSSLDNETETALIDALSSLKGKMTILMVAHRLSSIRYCEREIHIG